MGQGAPPNLVGQHPGVVTGALRTRGGQACWCSLLPWLWAAHVTAAFYKQHSCNILCIPVKPRQPACRSSSIPRTHLPPAGARFTVKRLLLERQPGRTAAVGLGAAKLRGNLSARATRRTAPAIPQQHYGQAKAAAAGRGGASWCHSIGPRSCVRALHGGIVSSFYIRLLWCLHGSGRLL